MRLPACHSPPCQGSYGYCGGCGDVAFVAVAVAAVKLLQVPHSQPPPPLPTHMHVHTPFAAERSAQVRELQQECGDLTDKLQRSEARAQTLKEDLRRSSEEASSRCGAELGFIVPPAGVGQRRTFPKTYMALVHEADATGSGQEVKALAGKLYMHALASCGAWANKRVVSGRSLVGGGRVLVLAGAGKQRVRPS